PRVCVSCCSAATAVGLSAVLTDQLHAQFGRRSRLEMASVHSATLSAAAVEPYNSPPLAPVLRLQSPLQQQGPFRHLPAPAGHRPAPLPTHQPTPRMLGCFPRPPPRSASRAPLSVDWAEFETNQTTTDSSAIRRCRVTLDRKFDL